MRVLLIDPPFDILQGTKTTANYPLGLGYIAAVLNENGHEAKYVNLDWDPELPACNPFSRLSIERRYNLYLRETSDESTHHVWSDFAHLLKEFRPDIVGITTNTLKIQSTLRLLRIVKGIDTNIFTVLGGHHSQVLARDIMEKCCDLDFVVFGEGETTMVELVGHLEKNTLEECINISGLVFRDCNSNVITNEETELIDPLDDLPFPSECFSYVKRQLSPIPSVALMASRGCPYSCNYCATNNIWRRKIRRRSPQNVIDEIKLIRSRQNIGNFAFYDDCFTLDKRWLVEFCERLIRDDLKISWSCITSSKLVDEQIFSMIVRAGCRKINIGVESGSERILKVANKRIDLDEVRGIFRLSRKYKISTSAYFMLGLPSETMKDIRLTQDLIREIRPDWIYCNVLVPLPGTTFFDVCVENGSLDPSNAWRGDTVGSPIRNFTGTMPDKTFFELVDETFQLGRKINTSWRNLVKRAPIRSYLTRPNSFISDIKKAVSYRLSQ